jgi:MFS family permease
LALPGVGQYLYALVFLVNGIYFSGSLMGFLNYLLELTTEEQRPLFIGLSNTLTAPSLLAPLLGGWLVSLWSYEAVFLLALLFGILALFASLGLKEPKLESHPEPYIPPESGRLSG